MGVQKEITDHRGLKAIYWNIGFFRVDCKLKFVDCRMYGYPSREEYEKGADPIMVRPVRCIWDDYEQFFSTEEQSKTGNNMLKSIYGYMKIQETLFTDAVDVLEPVKNTDTINGSEETK